jgi:hypothetical protein
VPGGLELLMIMTPVIEVSRDGKTAKGMWQTLSCVSRRNETGLHALWATGKYDNEFVKEDGKWKFRSIRWYLNFRTPFEEGWVKRPMGAVGHRLRSNLTGQVPTTCRIIQMHSIHFSPHLLNRGNEFLSLLCDRPAC